MVTDFQRSWDGDRHELMLACDGEGRIVSADAKSERTLGPCIGKPFLDLVAPGLAEKAMRLLTRGRSERVNDSELPLRVGSTVATFSFSAKPDEKGDVLLLGIPVPDMYLQALTQAQESMDEIVNLHRLVSRQKRELQQQHDKLEKTHAFEQLLIGIASHDLRNPLAVILLNTTLLLRVKEMSERETRFINRIHTSAQGAIRLVGDLLDFTKTRLTGGIQIRREPVDLRDVVRRAIVDVHGAFPGGDIRLDSADEARGEWDPERLAQVVSNLLSNAVKYSPEGSPVQITIRADSGSATVSIQNMGVVIPSEKLSNLFEPFERANVQSGADRSIGLGLYIVKQIVESHGGRIVVTSTEADGTTFTVHLPRNASLPEG